MCGEIFWKRIVVFGLTFGLGVLVSSFFISGGVHQPEVIQPRENKTEINPPKGFVEPQELKKKTSQKPLCKRYEDNRNFLIIEQLRLKNLLKNGKNISQKQKEIYLQEIKEIQKSISKLNKTPHPREPLPEDFKPTHNLLYVEKCVEY